jgi:hypothetical protein
MSKHFIFLSGLLTIFAFFSNISQTNSVGVQEITDSNINSLVGDGTGQNVWLLMFYLDECPYCKVAKESFSKLARRDEIETDETLNKIKIGQIECSRNNWSCLRFNITRVPTIVQLKHDKLFGFNKYVTDDSLLRFLAEEKLLSDGMPIPEPMGMISMATRVLRGAVDVLNDHISEFISNNLKLNIQWTSSCTVALLALILFLIILSEYYLVKFFLGNKEVPLKKVENKTDEVKKEEANIKKEKDD